MEQQRTSTIFLVDDKLCTGCGTCVKSCPMKILILQDNICNITDPSRCLECRTCMRDCTENAINIREGDTESSKTGRLVGVPDKTAGPKIEFTPILDTLWDMIKDLNPQQEFKSNGIDVRALNDFKLEGKKSYTRLYRADKLEKVGISSVNFLGSMRTDVLVITPAPEYDIPYYIMDWCESEDHIFYICDLMPGDDPGRDIKYLQNFLHDELEDLYHEYKPVPGLTGSIFHWVRAIHSPYLLTGTVEKKPKENVDMLFSCAVDYLKAWLNLYNNAKPQDINSPRMKLIQERRKAIRTLYTENDPGAGALDKFLGQELANVQLTIIEP
ncbi:4Fe-4S binding protein [Spirochaetota bacterium]